jgi:hypothetical protein
MGKTIYVTDRSAADLDDKCGMAFWWNRIQDDIGIVPASEHDALTVGKEIHDDLQRIAEAEDPAEEAEKIAAQVTQVPDGALPLAKEKAYRRAGWAIAFALYIEPTIRKNWENVRVEGELILDRTPLWVPVTPDRVLRHKEQRGLYQYKEYKSSITANKNWLDSWRYSIQLQIGLKAIEEETGIKPGYAQIMALIKGDERDGRLRHPYTWGYYNSSTREWTHDYAKARSSAWDLRPVWEFPEGISGWVKHCGNEVAESQFPHTPPVTLNERMLNLWVARKQARMQQINIVRESCKVDPVMRNVFFEMRTNQCRPAFGAPCPYQMACWNSGVNKNPLGSGEYVKRTPHHEVEILLRKERDAHIG